ncbi:MULTISPECIES: ABC transporter permease [Methanosarcina]|uniref:Cell division protein FtsX n=3 Tax=Methanosarcina barkeri TaxID=2208 RepID=A0A0E3QVR7_METBA|nr:MULTISPECIES: ABC transporter permease [Methanosarcina]AKB54857.1 Cell division protein FtsX [Methanosarcina barkeri MS]AKB57067.1 Cell division protein FtsX [Methanosarcina barkeri 227]AKJ37632.1 ABC transporter permease protein [Methanosarcina barkeri CM1]OEC91002.1 ABC transporter substrate-binding protein [Methanosarcina sp. A14]
MRNSTYLKMGLNMLVHSKLRSWLTIIGIVIGIGSVVGILSLGDAMQEQVQSRLAEMDLTKITISPGYIKASSNMPGPPGMRGSSTDAELTDDDIEALQGLDGIQYIAGQISGSESVIYAAQNATLSITGVDPQVWRYMTTLKTQSGRLLEPADKYVAVIGSVVASGVYDQEIGVNQVITVNGKAVRVVGILEEEGGRGDRSIYMPLDGAVNLLDDAEEGVYDSITVKARSEDLVDELMEDIVDKLMVSRHIIQVDDRDFSVTASKSMAESVTEMTSSMTLFLGAIAAVSLLVGAVGIANTMFTSVLEKTKEIGTMKAIGSKNRDILMIFLFNSAMVGLVGGILGDILGACVSTLFPVLGLQMMRGRGSDTFEVYFAPDLMAFGLLLAVLIGVISGIIPAYRASKLKPVDALRYE